MLFVIPVVVLLVLTKSFFIDIVASLTVCVILPNLIVVFFPAIRTC